MVSEASYDSFRGNQAGIDDRRGGSGNFRGAISQSTFRSVRGFVSRRTQAALASAARRRCGDPSAKKSSATPPALDFQVNWTWIGLSPAIRTQEEIHFL